MLRRLFIAASVYALASVCYAQLIDGGFESPALSGGSSAYVYQPTGTAWVFGVGAGIQRNGSAWGGDNAPDGVQTAFLQGGAASVSQQVTLEAGNYLLFYSLARRPYGGPNPIQVFWDGHALVLSIPYDEEWQLFYYPLFNITAGTHTLTFSGTSPGDIGNGDNSTFLDAVIIMQLNNPTVNNVPDVGGG